MNAHPADISQIGELAARLAALEERVSTLEHPHAVIDTATQVSLLTPATAAPVAGTNSSPAPAAQWTSTFSLLGASLLGIAGAYVLRALSGAAIVPRGVIAAVAAIYAAAWLIAASRAASRPLAATLYAATSTLIVAPMLWEMTIRFHAISAPVAAVILIAYTGLATLLALRTPHSAVFTTAYAGAAFTAVALSIATHFMAPFAAILLAMLAVCDLRRDSRVPALHVLIALLTDFSIWALIFIYRLAPDARTDYPPMSVAGVIAFPALLFGMQGALVFIDVIRRAQPITTFQALQAMIAFAITLCALIWLLPSVAGLVIGILSLALSVGCYTLSYGRFHRDEQRRNFRIFAMWAAALWLGGLFALAPKSVLSAVAGISGVAVIFLAGRMRAITIELQGVLFLTIGIFASGALLYVYDALAGVMPGLPGWPASIVILCALAACWMAGESKGDPAVKQFLRFIPAFFASFALAAICIWCLHGLLTMVLIPGAFHVALLRTLTLCVLSMASAWGGARLDRIQFSRVAYCALAFAAAKLLLEDLRHGHLEFMAASIFLVALTLIIVPRFARTAHIAQLR